MSNRGADSKYRLDCRRFRGDVPCAPGMICAGCDEFEAIGARILVIKLGAIGDVLRTTPILQPLRKKLGFCHITWIVDKESAPLLKNNPHIDRLVEYGSEAVIRAMVEKFDYVYGLDKHPGAAGLATITNGPNKAGFILDPSGAISFTGESAEYAYRLGLDDELKFRGNKKTYQEMTFDMLGLEWEKQGYILELSEEVRKAGKSIVESLGLTGNSPVIGLFTGAGDVWPMKRWTVSGFSRLTDMLAGELGASVMLLGAERDKPRNMEIAESASSSPLLAPHDLDVAQFAGLVGACDLIVTGDTLAMHLGLALDVPTVVIFGPTSAVEVEMYGVGAAVVSEMDCSPCYRSVCPVSPTCMERIGVDEVFKSVKDLLRK